MPAQPLYTVQLLGGEHRYLTDAAGAVWGPSDESIVYFTAANDSYLIRSDGTGAPIEFVLLAVPTRLVQLAAGWENCSLFNQRPAMEMSSEGTHPHELL